MRLAFKNMTLKSVSSADASSQNSSSVTRFPFKTRSPSVFSHRMLRLSHPGNGTGSLISKMGNSTLEKHAYSVRAWTREEMQGLLYCNLHAMLSFRPLLRSVDVMFSLSDLRESSF